jgi:virginiamycin A acetyltransferase
MIPFVYKIPILRTIVRSYLKFLFRKKWRSNNRHNTTSIGEWMFPMENVSVGNFCCGVLNIQSMYPRPNKGLVMGNFVSVAPEVLFLLDVNHQTQTFSTFPFHTRLIGPTPLDAGSKGPIIVGDEVCFGTNAVILSGVTIGKGAIIAAKAVVTSSVPPYAIAGGNPAKIIKYRFSKDIIAVLEPIKLMDIKTEWLRNNIEELYTVIATVDDAIRIRDLIHKSQATDNR